MGDRGERSKQASQQCSWVQHGGWGQTCTELSHMGVTRAGCAESSIDVMESSKSGTNLHGAATHANGPRDTMSQSKKICSLIPHWNNL